MAEVSDELKKLARLLDSRNGNEPTLEEGLLKFIWNRLPDLHEHDMAGYYLQHMQGRGLAMEACSSKYVTVAPNTNGIEISINTNHPSFEAFAGNIFAQQTKAAAASLAIVPVKTQAGFLVEQVEAMAKILPPAMFAGMVAKIASMSPKDMSRQAELAAAHERPKSDEIVLD